MDTTHKGIVEILLKKAAAAHDAAQAINFAQAACNAANASRVIAEIERQETETQPK